MSFDKIILFPYYMVLRHRGKKYSHPEARTVPEIPVICIGNVTVGGTGKTPHTEMVLRLLENSYEWKDKSIAVLSRGYKRSSKGFQQVTVDGTASFYGDEPLQIKRKFPQVTVVLDKDRVRGCKYLSHPDFVKVLRSNRKCVAKEFKRADIVVLDDGFQYMKLKPTINIVLVDYSRPVYKDRLIPFGDLRDLPDRISEAEIVIVTKCPSFLSDEDRAAWREDLHLGKGQKLFFTTVSYGQAEPVYKGGCDTRYRYSKQNVLFTGIAQDLPFRRYLCDEHQIMEHIIFPDHHKYSDSDISRIHSAARRYPMASVMTTQKDATRIVDNKNVPSFLQSRMFYVPIEPTFLTREEQTQFTETLLAAIRRS